MKKSVRELQASEIQRIKSAHEQILLKKQCRSSRLKLEDILADLGSMKEISWGKSAGREVW
jgi:hypothetical protein